MSLLVWSTYICSNLLEIVTSLSLSAGCWESLPRPPVQSQVCGCCPGVRLRQIPERSHLGEERVILAHRVGAFSPWSTALCWHVMAGARQSRVLHLWLGSKRDGEEGPGSHSPFKGHLSYFYSFVLELSIEPENLCLGFLFSFMSLNKHLIACIHWTSYH